jgi:hypothetical protein
MPLPSREYPMPRYLFHIIGEDARQSSVRDGEGAMLRDATEARKEAVGLAQDIARHGLDESAKWKVVVTDEHGANIVTVPLSQVHTFRTRAWWAVRGVFSKFLHRSSRTLAWSILAAAIIAQAVVVFTLVQNKGTYETASAPSKGAVVAIRFVGTATMNEISAFLESQQSTIIDGPRVGGFYRVRITHSTLPQGEFARLVARMSQEKVVEFIAAVE